MLVALISFTGWVPIQAAHCETNKLIINGLTDHKPGIGSFRGIEHFKEPLEDGRYKVSIVYFHGIGWTQRNGKLASDFADAIGLAYGPDFALKSGHKAGTRCPVSDGPYPRDFGGLNIRPSSSGVTFNTDLAGDFLWIYHIGCVDRQILNAGGDLEYHIYRLFWDDLFWNALQVAYVGYDDYALYGDVGADANESGVFQPNDQRIAERRRAVSRALKDELITYGLSDAALYLGPAGEYLREAVKAAICLAAADNPESSDSLFNALEHESRTSEMRSISVADSCSSKSKKQNKLVFVAESMGSRALFDVLQEAHFKRENNLLKRVTSESPAIYLLANQIPLMGLGRLNQSGASYAKGPAQRTMGTLIAFSEVNDLLTYELVPYAEQLWLRSVGSIQEIRNRHRERRSLTGIKNVEVRERIASAIGFDIVDVRVEFADSFQNMESFADPFQAHAGLNREQFITQIIICGAENGISKGVPGEC